MLTVAYLANLFPSPVEPYVKHEIEELRSRDLRVVTGSVRRPPGGAESDPEIVLLPWNIVLLCSGLWLCLREWRRISIFIRRIVFQGGEGPLQRVKALAHTLLGACYAIRLRQHRVDHIHVHHGYFGSWIAMVAARLLGTGYSMTLHGSDLLVNGAYLDLKLKECSFCLTVSEYNRGYILDHYPRTEPEKVLVSRLGVEVGDRSPIVARTRPHHTDLVLLAVGRLHPVKDHAFLVQACARLHEHGVRLECSIAGEGPERKRLEGLIATFDLEEQITLLGHVPREQMDSLYDRADVVVLTSRSEGIPLVLMEAMARGKIVLAPAITGIPELILPGKTGFLYEPGSMDDFVDRLLFIHSLIRAETLADGRRHEAHSVLLSALRQLDWVRHAARVQVRHVFNRKTNLKSFGDLFLARVAATSESLPHESSVLQQIQPSLQRNRGVPVSN